VNDPVPPLALTVAVPVLPPQVVLVVFTDPLIAAGCVMFTNVELEHPAPSVTVTV
jgi:hypothetical protein